MKKVAVVKPGVQRRREKRVPSALPIVHNGKMGVTRDISSTGVLFEIDHDMKAGSKINFAIDLETPGGKLKLVCEAEVVRVTHKDGRSSVAAKIIHQNLESSA